MMHRSLTSARVSVFVGWEFSDDQCDVVPFITHCDAGRRGGASKLAIFTGILGCLMLVVITAILVLSS